MLMMLAGPKKVGQLMLLMMLMMLAGFGLVVERGAADANDARCSRACGAADADDARWSWACADDARCSQACQKKVGQLMLMMLGRVVQRGQPMLMMLAGLGLVVEGGAADADDARWCPACGGRWGS